MVLALKLAFRRLLKTPGFTFIALTTLAVCLGSNLTIFAVVDAIVLKSLPFPEPERLVTLINGYPGAGVPRASASLPNYLDRKEAIKAFAGVSLFSAGNVIVGSAGSPDRVEIARITPEFFQTLGVPLAMGATFTTQQLVYGSDSVAILTDTFWQTYFNRDPHVLGRTFFNDGFSVTVVGVLPPGFHYLSNQAQFFRPAAYDANEAGPQNRHSNNWDMVARLAPGATLADAQAQVDALNAQQVSSNPAQQIIKDAGFHTMVLPLHEDHIRSVKPILILLQCGVLFLLLIGCVNLVNLLLIRASNRSKEFSVRQALGAKNRHIIQDVLVETMLLGLGGSIYGLILGVFGIDFLRFLGANQLPLGASIVFDARIAAAAFAIALVVSIFLAGPVIVFIAHIKLATGLQLEARGGSSNRAAQNVRHLFIVVQLALAFVLLTGAGLLAKSFYRTMVVRSGFNPEHVLAGAINLPWKNYHEISNRIAFVDRLVANVSALPGISHACVDTNLPFTPDSRDNVISIEGKALKAGDAIRAHYVAEVSGDFLATMGINLLQGRFLTNADAHRKTSVCVIDETVAKTYWPGENPIGHRLAQDFTFKEENASTIIGVVADVKQHDLAQKSQHGTIYFPYSESNMATFSLYIVVRSILPASSIGPAVRREVLQLDPELPLSDLKVMQTRIDDSLVARRSPAILAVIFAGAALLLAALGTYGVLSYAVAQRRTEIGVRIALGARPAQIRNQFLGMGLRLLTVAAVLGFIGCWFTGRAMQANLFEVPAFDVGVFSGVFLILSSVALAACLIPAHRATRIDPADSIRS